MIDEFRELFSGPEFLGFDEQVWESISLDLSKMRTRFSKRATHQDRSKSEQKFKNLLSEYVNQLRPIVEALPLEKRQFMVSKLFFHFNFISDFKLGELFQGENNPRVAKKRLQKIRSASRFINSGKWIAETMSKESESFLKDFSSDLNQEEVKTLLDAVSIVEKKQMILERERLSGKRGRKNNLNKAAIADWVVCLQFFLKSKSCFISQFNKNFEAAEKNTSGRFQATALRIISNGYYLAGHPVEVFCEKNIRNNFTAAKKELSDYFCSLLPEALKESYPE